MSVKTFTTADLANHASKSSLYLAVGGKVYDCTEFIDEHPGGEEVLLEEAGKDATESFEDVGHSEEAREIMHKMYVGDYKDDNSGKKAKSPSSSTPKPIHAGDKSDSGSTSYIVAAVVVAGCVLWKFLL